MVHDGRPDAPPNAPEARFTDTEARQLLARAAERERALGASISATQLRDAALEAGISAAAFDDAVAEMRAARTPAPLQSRRRRKGLLAIVVGLVLVVGTGSVALLRTVAPAETAAPVVIANAEASPVASTCGPPDGVPIERLQAIASGLYPELLTPSNRHRSLTVALLFDATCHVKGHTLMPRGANDGNEEVLRAAFPPANRQAWQMSGGADAGPWTFEPGKPMIVWGLERAPR